MILRIYGNPDIRANGGVCWGATRRAWLGRQAFSLPGQQQAFDDYPFAVDQVDRRIEMLEAELDRLAGEGPHHELIARLRCMRGIDTR